ncbi:hypothetical protein DI272_07165 [Streptomyces sp. Act143]|uniref:hypothetical protein n=1 Tax=Streptomyces sp. Act143 TaxID=2200760 RepID=UPI000D675E8E|nr:hypothetical protein [Streptomyces sp. Act143]PWI13958.1 hypothetical protein DI272_07165 [Streptomyces sp. Act143]
MINGYVLGESLRPGAEFAPPGLRVRAVRRMDVSESAAAGQPPLWTLVEWEADDDADVTVIADALAGVLEPECGWYADFTAGDECLVVFAGKVFRYRRGDPHGRAEAVAYGRSVGTPEHQLDWRE